jgi:hypothetical protein
MTPQLETPSKTIKYSVKRLTNATMPSHCPLVPSSPVLGRLQFSVRGASSVTTILEPSFEKHPRLFRINIALHEVTLDNASRMEYIEENEWWHHGDSLKDIEANFV